MARYDQGYVDGLLSLAQRRPLTKREKKALADAMKAVRLEREMERKRVQMIREARKGK